MDSLSYIMPEDAWAYLFGLHRINRPWCFPLERQPDVEAGYRFLVGQGLLIDDGETALIEPVLNDIAKAVSQGGWSFCFGAFPTPYTLVICDALLLLVITIPERMLRIAVYKSTEEAENDLLCEMEGYWERYEGSPLSIYTRDACAYQLVKQLTQSELKPWLDEVLHKTEE